MLRGYIDEHKDKNNGVVNEKNIKKYPIFGPQSRFTCFEFAEKQSIQNKMNEKNISRAHPHPSNLNKSAAATKHGNNNR